MTRTANLLALCALFVLCTAVGWRLAFAQQPSGQPAAAAGKTVSQQEQWKAVTPEKPQCQLNSNMTVDLDWPSVRGAESYLVYWSPKRDFQKNSEKSAATNSTSFNHKARRGQYEAQWPMYYRVAALKGGVESQLSEACLVQLRSSEGGKVCQICGNESVGWCHLRKIHVCSGHNVFTDDERKTWRCP